MKRWYKSKTVWFNLITTALAVVSELSNVFPMKDHPGIWITITTFGNLLLRVISKGGVAITKKQMTPKKSKVEDIKPLEEEVVIAPVVKRKKKPAVKKAAVRKKKVN